MAYGDRVTTSKGTSSYNNAAFKWATGQYDDEKEAEERLKQYKKFSKTYDQYKDETGSLHVGDSIIEDNEDGTFTDSSGKQISISQLNDRLRKVAETQKAETEKAEANKKGFFGKVGDVAGKVGGAVVDGVAGNAKFSWETGASIKNLAEIRAQQSKESRYLAGEREINDKYEKEADEKVWRGYEGAESVEELPEDRQKAWKDIQARRTKEMSGYSSSNERGDAKRTKELFDEQAGIAERFDKAGKQFYNGLQYVPGIGLGAETVGGIAGAIAGDDSEISKRQMELTQNIEDWDKLTDEEKEQAKAMRTVGGALSTLDIVMPGSKIATTAVKGTVKGGLKEGAKQAGEAYSKSVLSKGIGEVAGVGAKELAKQGFKSSAVGGVVGTGIGAGLSAAMGGDVGEGAMQGAASGIVGGFLGSPLDVSTGKAGIKQAAKDADAARVKARDENIARLRKEMEDDYLNKQKAADQFAADSQGTGQAQLPEGNRVKMLMATNPRDDVPATTLADGSQIVSGKYQRSNVNRIKEIDKQLSDFNSGNSKLSGEQAKALADERKAVINEINSEYDARTNVDTTVDKVNSELLDIAGGDIPDDTKIPAKVVQKLEEVQNLEGIDGDIRGYALEIARDRADLEQALEPMMTQKNYDTAAKALDEQYAKDLERIEQMPPRRQERELAKLNEKYDADLNDLDAQLAEAAPVVEEFTRMGQFLDSKEADLINYVNGDIIANPGKVYSIDETRLNGKVDQLVQQQRIAEVTESVPDNQKALVGSVENGVRPSENTNPRVQAAIETNKVANSGNINDSGVGLSYYATAPAKVLERFGDEGKQISNILSEATDSTSIADQQVATKVLKWNKQAGGKNGMREVAKALDGDTESFSRLSDNQRVVFNEVRDMFKAYADYLGLPEGARIKDYLPHIMNGQTLDKVDSAVMRLATGKNLDGTTLTAKDIKEANAAIKGIDYETLQMIKKNSMFKVSKNGFLEKRTGAEDYSLDLAEIINTYTHAAHNTLYIKPALEAVKPLSEALSPKQNEYLAQLMGEIQNMHTADIDSRLNTSLSRIPILGDNAFSKGSSITRKLIYDALLGANPGSAIRNLSQGANTYAKLGNKYTAHGIKMAGASFSKSNGLYDELLRNGVLMNKFSDLLHEGTMSSARSGLDRGLWTMFSSVEQFNRATAYFGAKQRYIDKFVKAAQKRGEKIDINNLPEGVLQVAEDAGRKMSKNTQFEFGVMDIPLGQTSNFAKNAIQFQSFNISQVKFLKGMIVGDTDSLFVKQANGKHKLSAEGAAQIARYVGAQAVFIGTVGSLIGMSFEDMVPFVGDVADAQQEGDIMKAVPSSPITKLLIGNQTGDKGLVGLVTGNQDPIEYGKDLASTLLPGGTQARKTIEGLASTEEGVSTNASGKVRFVQDQDFSNRLRAGLFGQYQTDAGRSWVSDGFPTFSEKQSQKIGGQETFNDKERYADMYKITSGKKAARDEIEEVYKSRGSNAAFRKTQEWNDKQDKLIAEYRQKHPGVLPKEISDALNKSKIIYKNLRMEDD